MATQTPSPTPTPTTQTQPQPQPQTQPNSAQPTSKTPVSLHPQSHLDPSAYVRGHNSIQIGPNVLIHPRTHLISLHSALTIAESSIIAEKSIIGGPLPPSTTATESPAQTQPPSSTTTEIGIAVHVHPNVTVNSGAKISDYAVLESNVVVQHGVTVGKHSKICAGVVLSRDVPDWMVVYGLDGEKRRARRGGAGGGADVIETGRLQVMEAEREATMAILKKAAARSVGAAKGRR